MSPSGSEMKTILLTEMASAWQELPRRQPLAERYAVECVADINRFVQSISKGNGKVTDMASVTTGTAKEFMRAEQLLGVSPKRYNDVLKLLRSCFANLTKEAGLTNNPSDGTPTKELNTVHRRPFSENDLHAITEASKSEPMTHALIVVEATTAMRLGDCSKLCWKNINDERTYIDVKTAKTKRWITIPLFPLLRDVLALNEVLKTPTFFRSRQSNIKPPGRAFEASADNHARS
jgi:integrase